MSSKGVVERIKDALSDVLEGVEEGKGVVHVFVPVDRIVDAARKLKEIGFDHVKDVTAVDYPKENVIKIIYHASSYSDVELSRYIVGLGYSIPRDRERVPSLYYVWTTADFLEREIYEGFGIVFEGHPDLRPLLLSPPVAELKPMRKDFVVKEEPIFRK